MVVKCPKCEYPQYCGFSDNKDVPDGFKPYVWDGASSLIVCANCGLRMCIDDWIEWGGYGTLKKEDDREEDVKQ